MACQIFFWIPVLSNHGAYSTKTLDFIWFKVLFHISQIMSSVLGTYPPVMISFTKEIWFGPGTHPPFWQMSWNIPFFLFEGFPKSTNEKPHSDQRLHCLASTKGWDDRGIFELTLQYGGSEMHPDTGGYISPPSKFSKFSIFPLKKRNFWYDFFLIFQKFIMN